MFHRTSVRTPVRHSVSLSRAAVAPALVGFCVAMLLASSASAEPPPLLPRNNAGCNSAAFVGDWAMTSRVFRAKKKSAAGVNGYYYLQIRGKGCQLDATLTKVGFSVAKGIREFPPHKRQIGVSKLKVSTDGTADMTVTIRRPDGTHAQSMRLGLIAANGRIEAVWAYEGGSWNATQMRGSMIGSRGANSYPTHRKASDVMCILQCTLHCGAVKPDGVTLPETNDAGLGRCATRCQSAPRATVYGCQ